MASITMHICKKCGWVSFVHAGGPYDNYVNEKKELITTDDWKKPVEWFKSKKDGYYSFKFIKREIPATFIEKIKAKIANKKIEKKHFEKFEIPGAHEEETDGLFMEKILIKVGEGKMPKNWKEHNSEKCIKCGSTNLGFERLVHMTMRPPKGFGKAYNDKISRKLKEYRQKEEMKNE